jgi:hypothetical protein
MIFSVTASKKTTQKYLRAIGVFVSALTLLSSVTLAESEEESIRASFSSLQKAFLAHDPALALNLLSSDTKDYYRMLTKLAQQQTLSAESEKNLTPLNLMMLKLTKEKLPPGFLQKATGDKDHLLRIAVKSGLGSKELTNGISLGRIEVRGDTATAELFRGEKLLPLRLGFRREIEKGKIRAGKVEAREAGAWKVSLLSLFEYANKMAEQFLNRTGMPKEALQELLIKK